MCTYVTCTRTHVHTRTHAHTHTQTGPAVVVNHSMVHNIRMYVCMYVCMYIRTCTERERGVTQDKVPVPYIRRTLAVLPSFEPCHLNLVLSTCPTIIMFFDLVILTATTTRAIRHVDNTR